MTDLKKTLLLVEDDAITAKNQAFRLEDFGYRVITVYNGADAVACAASEESIDLVLMDIDLGEGMDGTETAERILKLRNVPIMFLTSHIEKEIVDRVKSITRYGYILKHAGDFVLHSSVEMALDLFSAQQRTRESEEKYRQLVENAKSIILRWNTDGVITYINSYGADFFGYTPAVLLGQKLIGTIVPKTDTEGKDLEILLANIAADSDTYLHNENENMTRDGRSVWINWTNTALRDGTGAISEILSVGNDITDKKNADGYRVLIRQREKKLTGLSELLSQLITRGGWFDKDFKTSAMEITENAAGLMETERCSIWLYNDDLSEITCFDLYTSSSGLHTEGEILNSSEFPEYSAYHQMGRVITAEDVYRDPRTASIPHEYYRATGITSLIDAPVWFHGKLKALLSFEHVGPRRKFLPEEEQTALTLAAYISLCLESQERYRAERTAREREDKFSRIFMMVPDTITITTVPEGRFVEVNDGFVRNTGFDRSEVIGKTARELGMWVHTQEYDAVESLIRENGHFGDMELHFRLKSGLMVIVLSSGRVIEINGLPYLLSVFRDITLRKAMELALRESEKKFKLLFHSAPVGIFRYDTGFTLQECNDSFVKIMQSQRERLLGIDITQLRDRRVVDCIRNSLEGKNGVYEGHYRTTTSDVQIWISLQTVPLWDSESKIIGGIGIVQDFTDRKRDSDRIQSLLEEKDLLLREVHHRIKNNMLTISSLLSLQAKSLSDKAAVAALKDSSSRIQSMMHIYDVLYRSEDVSQININQYLTNLIDEISATYMTAPGKVRIKTAIQDIEISTRTAFPVGLIVNELVSNSMKYAFRDNGSGEIEIRLGQRDNGSIELMVRDNGPGLPGHIDALNPKGFGLNLVNLLVRQIKGAITYTCEKGSVFIIRFRS